MRWTRTPGINCCMHVSAKGSSKPISHTHTRTRTRTHTHTRSHTHIHTHEQTVFHHLFPNGSSQNPSTTPCPSTADCVLGTRTHLLLFGDDRRCTRHAWCPGLFGEVLCVHGKCCLMTMADATLPNKQAWYGFESLHSPDNTNNTPHVRLQIKRLKAKELDGPAWSARGLKMHRARARGQTSSWRKKCCLAGSVSGGSQQEGGCANITHSFSEDLGLREQSAHVPRDRLARTRCGARSCRCGWWIVQQWSASVRTAGRGPPFSFSLSFRLGRRHSLGRTSGRPAREMFFWNPDAQLPSPHRDLNPSPEATSTEANKTKSPTHIVEDADGGRVWLGHGACEGAAAAVCDVALCVAPLPLFQSSRTQLTETELGWSLMRKSLVSASGKDREPIALPALLVWRSERKKNLGPSMRCFEQMASLSLRLAARSCFRQRSSLRAPDPAVNFCPLRIKHSFSLLPQVPRLPAGRVGLHMDSCMARPLLHRGPSTPASHRQVVSAPTLFHTNAKECVQLTVCQAPVMVRVLQRGKTWVCNSG
jgi:hypothetical protein